MEPGCLYRTNQTQHKHVRDQQSRVVRSLSLAVCELEVLRFSLLAVALVRQEERDREREIEREIERERERWRERDREREIEREREAAL